MLDLTKLNQTDLSKQETLFDAKESVEDIIMHYDSKEARILVRFLEEKLTKNKITANQEEYEKIVHLLKFIYLYTLSDNEIISLYQHDFGKILEYNEFYQPFEALRIKLISLAVEERDAFKNRAILALAVNKELITRQALFYAKGVQSQAPSIENWLKDYAKTVGGGDFTNLAKANYFTKSENYRQLSGEEKNKVKKLFEFYFRLHLSSMTPRGFENDIIFTDKDGKIKIISEGKIIDTSKVALQSQKAAPAKKLVATEKEEKKIFQDPARQELIKILQEEFTQDTGGDFNKLIQELKQSIEIESTEEITAILRILDKQGKLGEVRQDKKLWGELERMGVAQELRVSASGGNSEKRKVMNEKRIVKNEKLPRPKLIKTPDTPKIQAIPAAVQAQKKVIPTPAPKPVIKKVTLPAPPAKPAKKQAVALKTIKQLMQQVLIGASEEAEEINRFEARIGTAEGKEVEKIAIGLQQGIKNKKIAEVVARLRLLAKLDPQGLINLLQPGTQQNVATFQNLIKNILSGMLGLPEPEAARYAMQLAMILKKQGQPQFMKVVYFDKAAKVFKWNKV